MNLDTALEICNAIQSFLNENLYLNANVALTGGCLYKTGERKDCDLLIYPHKDDLPFEPTKIIGKLVTRGIIYPKKDYGRVFKVQYKYQDVDILFPGREGRYPVAENADLKEIGFGENLESFDDVPF